MTIFTGTKTKYGDNGLREDLSNIIYDISPTETPFISSISRENAKNTLHEWQTDSLAAATTANAQLEGDDITDYGTLSSTVRVGNYCQISRKLAAVSGTLESIDKAGRNSEMAYQLVKKGKELKRDMETIALANIAPDAGGPTTARQMATLGCWVKTNTDISATSSGNPTYTSGVPAAARTDGTARAITTTIINSVCSAAWTTGADVNVLMVGTHVKKTISTLTSAVTRNYDITGKPRPTAFIGAIDVYVSDFQILEIIPNRYQRGRDAWFLDMDYCCIAQLRPMHSDKMARTGDADKRMLLVEWTLVVKNEAALGLAADLSTS